MMKKKYYQYAEDVVAGKIIAGDLIIKACQRFLTDLKRPDLEFREDKVDNAINFISMLRHFTGKSAGKPFILEPWQAFVTANLTGFFWKDSGLRRFTNAYLECSRKQGKTAFAVALCVYFFLGDGEAGAEVDFAANSKEQAKIAFTFAQMFCRGLDPKQRDIKIYRDRINVELNASSMRVFASDDSKLDGFNASVYLLDEYHSAKNSKLRDVLKSSQGMRENPMGIIITTAGFDKTGPCYQLRTAYTEVLNGFKTDDSVFVGIWGLDDTDDWKNPAVWPKSNPNLNVTVTEKYIREQVQSAINVKSEEVGCRTKTLNQWCDAVDVWIPESYITKCRQKVDLEIFRGEYLYAGVDLSAVSDMTAVSVVGFKEKEGKYYFVTDYYLPEETLNNSVNSELYKLWARQGLLHITPGNVVDYEYITKDLLEKEKKFGVRIWQVNYDQWNATAWAIKATELGLNINPQSQSIGAFNQPTKELERIVLSNEAVIDSNEITAACFRNVTLRYDSNMNCKPDKRDTREKKIDGVISMIEALTACMENTSSYFKSWSMKD